MAEEPFSGRTDPAVPRWLARTAAVGGRLLVLAVLVWLLAAFAVKLTGLLVALLVALLLAGVAAPFVQWAAGKGVPRWVSAAGAVMLLLAALAGVGVGLGVRVADQLPQLRDQLQQITSDLSGTLGIVAGRGRRFLRG
jgi:predicted PurR-regulated permease PerM